MNSIWTSDRLGRARHLRQLDAGSRHGSGDIGGRLHDDTRPRPERQRPSDFQYKIGPLDTVNIIVWRNPELSMVVPVRPDGNVTTPLVDDIPALGKRRRRFRKDIEQALVQVHSRPGCNRGRHDLCRPARSPRSASSAKPTRPQILAFRKKLSLLDVMIAVGGLTDFADGNHASIYRADEGGKSYSVRLQDLVKRGDVTANVDMRPGDILIIPQSWF